MFNLYSKLYKNGTIINTFNLKLNDNSSLTIEILKALETSCNFFDISNPIWLDSNIENFKIFSKTRFYKDNFIDDIYFDFLEIELSEDNL